eukprot:104356-Amphidinium_carterae.1
MGFKCHCLKSTSKISGKISGSDVRTEKGLQYGLPHETSALQLGCHISTHDCAHEVSCAP